MMKDISLHLTDILENAVKAGATRVETDFVLQGTLFTMRVSDNGPGLPAAVRDNPTDPFATTRVERPVGLGLSLLRMAAESTGGRLEIESPPGGGVTLTAVFDLAHIDAQPLGMLGDAVAAALAAWPRVDFMVRIGPQKHVVMDTARLRAEINGVDFSHPKVHKYLSVCLRRDMASLETHT